jgi:hypothetical protein
MGFLRELKKRNPLLYWFGWYNLLAGIICLVLVFADNVQVLGISRWIKPAKFFLSVSVMIWTMNWILYYLDNRKSVRIISWIFVISMFVENAIISFQAARGIRSHFNVSDGFNGMLFGIMGTFIIIFTLSCVYVAILFFRQQGFYISIPYLWGIRLGLLLFILFSLEGGWMAGLMSHTVGGKDGGPGLPFVNWSTHYGDLRIAHFFGIHSLQVLPLIGYYLAKTQRQIIMYGALYFVISLTLFIQALCRTPLLF